MSKSRLGADAQLKVTPLDLKNKSIATQKAVNKVNGYYSEFCEIVEKTASYWTGEGAEAQRNNLTKQKSDVDEMFRRIKEHITDLQKMAGVYESAEEQARSAVENELPTDVII